MKKFTMVAIASLVLAVGQLAAAPISGNVGFGGSAIVAPVSAGDTSIQFNVLSPIGIAFGGDGNFGTLTSLGQIVSVNNTTLDSSNFAATTFTIGANGLTFVASSFSGASLVTGEFRIELLGTYAAPAFDDTLGSLTFTFQPPAISPVSTDGTAVYTYSASGSTIPEPSTYAMLGTALLGLGWMRRRKA